MPTLARVALVSCLFLYAFCPSAAAYRPRSLDEFRAQRDRLRDSQSASDFQSDAPPLNEREQLANAVIMRLKRAALDDGFVNPGRFNPAAHFFETRNATRASKLFRCMRRMPKGGILHAHDMALVSIDHLITITYRPLLWQCWDTSGGRIAAFRFSLLRPTHVTCSTGWKRTKEERKRVGAPKFDAIVRSQFSLRDGYPYADINAVWQRFEAIFDLVEPMLTYIDVWQDLIRQALAEAWADGVQYLELRTMLLALHDENGQVYDDASDLVRMYAHVVDEFKQRTPKFVGAKIIYAPMRQVPNERVAEYVQQVVQLQREHPDFVVGFDVVGQEDVGRTLASMAEVLVTVPSQVGLFYHAGETNWHGNQVDENLVSWDDNLVGDFHNGRRGLIFVVCRPDCAFYSLMPLHWALGALVTVMLWPSIRH